MSFGDIYNKMTYIYLVENCYGDPNKVYIGKTINSRESNHKKTYGYQIIYTFIDEINSLDRKEWEPLESYWIEQFKQWGFEIVNKRKKGGMGPEFLSKESRDKKSKAMLGKKHSQETCLKISQSRKGQKQTISAKHKISKALKGRKRSNFFMSESGKEKIKNIISKPILQFDKNNNLIQEWSSTQEAATYYNIQKGHICNALRGRSKTCCGFTWKYKYV